VLNPAVVVMLSLSKHGNNRKMSRDQEAMSRKEQ
jgi:hypothetical protein